MEQPSLRFKTDDGSDFPEWEEKTLGDVGSVSMCKRVFKEQTCEVGDVPFFKIGTFGGAPDAYISQSLFDELKSKYAYPKVGTILLSASGTIGRQVEYKGEDAYYQDSNIVWLEHDDTVLDSYLKQFYSVVKWQGLEGSTIKRLYNKTILDTPFYRPSLPEQRKIADCLSAVDAVIAAQQAEVDAWEQRKKGVMQTLFSQEVRFKADDGSDFPAWEEKTFWDVFSNLTNNTLSRECLNSKSGQARNIHYGDVLVKYGAVVDVQRDGVPFVNPDVECKRWDCLKNGDIVIADTAEDETVGKAVEISNIGSDIVYSGLHTIACRPKEEFALGYLGNYINSMSYHDQLRPYMQGIKVTSVSKTNIGLTHLLVPTLPEQRKISDCLTSMDEVIQKAKDELAKWQELKKGLLQQMFV